MECRFALIFIMQSDISPENNKPESWLWTVLRELSCAMAGGTVLAAR